MNITLKKSRNWKVENERQKIENGKWMSALGFRSFVHRDLAARNMHPGG